MKAVVDGGEVIASLGERILGRHGLEDIVDPLKDSESSLRKRHSARRGAESPDRGDRRRGGRSARC
jgi:hypothetical protein